MKSAFLASIAALALSVGGSSAQAALLTYDLSGNLTQIGGPIGAPIDIIETVQSGSSGALTVTGDLVVDVNHAPAFTLSGSYSSGITYDPTSDRLSSRFLDTGGNSLSYSLVVPFNFNPLMPQTLAITSSNGLYFDNGVGQDFATNTLTISAVSAVPLPASLPMFSTALLGLGAVGYGLTRNRKAALPA